jgi:Domain of unknown function (DUF4157)
MRSTHIFRSRTSSGPSRRGSFFGPAGGQSTFFTPTSLVQTKLSIGAPGDVYEREADAVAERVVSGQKPAPLAAGAGPLQLKCADCAKEEKLQRVATTEEEEPVQMEAAPEEEEPVQMEAAPEEEEVQAKSESGATTASPDFAARLGSQRGRGNELSPQVRSHMEQSIGADFSGVRVHTDSEAVQMNREVNAHAFTNGQDIYFNSGRYDPDTTQGQRLLAHELTHVVQQGGAGEKVQAYRPKSAFNFGKRDDTTLIEDSFNKEKDKHTKPWIEKITVQFNNQAPDAEGYKTWFGDMTVEYFPNPVARRSFTIPIAGGSKSLGLTDSGTFVVQRIEGVGYNSGLFTDPSVVRDETSPNKRYSKDWKTANMSYAVFYNRGEALHAGPIDGSSHGCVHIDWSILDTIKQINYHSIIGWTKVQVKYP